MAKKKIAKPVAEVSQPLPAGRELSRWEIQFRDETGKLPASLGLNTLIAARDWLNQHPEAKQMLAEENQRDLVALHAMLEEHGHKRRADLPADLRERLAKGLPEIVWDDWDSLTEEGRRKQGVWWVAQHHPALETNRQKGFDLVSKICHTEKEIRELELMRAQTPLELESQKGQLAELNSRLKKLNGQIDSNKSPNPQGETPSQRKKRLRQKHDELKVAGTKNPTQQLASEEGVSASRIRQLIGLGKDQNRGSNSNNIFAHLKTSTRKPHR